MRSLPTITVCRIGSTSIDYRIEGGNLEFRDPLRSWAAARESRPGKVAYSEFRVYAGGDQIASYGGEVWPTAWPEFFRATGGRGGIRITEEGQRALAVARANQSIKEEEKARKEYTR